MNEDGKWVTMNGTHVFIKEGQNPMDAFIKQRGKEKKKQSPVVNNAPDEIIDYLYNDTGRNIVSKTEIDDYINNDFLDDELSDYNPTKEEYEEVYKEIKKRGYKILDDKKI